MTAFDCDVVVIGGGPIGLAAALHARAAGMRVVVVEPRTSPVDKACGEGLMPGALSALQALGVDPPGRDFPGITYRAGSRVVRAGFTHGPGRGVRRTDLHQVLCARADETRVERLAASMRRLSQDTHGVRVEVRGARAPLHARYAVGADGLHSRTRRQLELHLTRRARRRFGLRQHFALPPWTRDVEVHWGREAEVYCTPVDDDVVGVAVLGDGSASFADQLARFPSLAERLATATAVSDLRGAGPLRQRARARAQGRVVLVGDAGGYVDALTGEGLAVGLAQAHVAVEALARGRPQDYPRRARQVSWRSTALTSALLGVSRVPPLRAAVVPAATLWPRGFRLAVDELAATAQSATRVTAPRRGP